MAESGVIKTPTVRIGYEVNHNTEAGLTDAQKTAILDREEKIRRNRDESMHVYNDSGKEVFFAQGEGPKVRLKRTELAAAKAALKDNVYTHNHPRSIGKIGVRSIGNAFSPQDVNTAVWGDARELRAVTPRYTFSMKRPAGGWGMTENQAKNLFAQAKRTVAGKGRDYLNKQGWDQTSQDRANALLSHQVNKEFVRLAKKKYGVDIIYRHRRVS